MTVKGFFKGIWQFFSFITVPQWGKHITEQAQNYGDDERKDEGDSSGMRRIAMVLKRLEGIRLEVREGLKMFKESGCFNK